jgi:asparagine synthase (glutamine-hydrolysing)
MCGIVASFGLNGAPAEPEVIFRMMEAIRHRGPDSDGSFKDGSTQLGFKRLSILDLSAAGHQPMTSPDGRVTVVFNGEIYNYLELRRELIGAGHEFRSSGDSEVLLHAYLEWGKECVSRFNGMWSFLIWDARRQVLIGSRDRFGKKPLYRYRCGDYFLFASEIKAILASGKYSGGPNWSLTARALMTGNLDHSPLNRESFFADVEQLPPATTFELTRDGKWTEHRYWSLTDHSVSPPENPAEAFRALFDDAVRLRMRSDVPVGVFLSGGLDSTAVACTIAAQRGISDQGMFAFSFHSDEFDESRYIADTVAQTGVHLVRYAPQAKGMWDSIRNVIRCQDEPVHSFAAIAVYELSRLAAEHGVKVVLMGGGADEYLAGYSVYFGNYWYQLARAGRFVRAGSEISAFSRENGVRRSRLIRNTLATFRTELTRLPAYRHLQKKKRVRSFLAGQWYGPEIKRYAGDIAVEYTPPTLDAALMHSVTSAPLPYYLRIDDRNTMAWSVEARSPFLDYRAVELAFSLPASWKIRGATSKVLLREAMKGRIPESVRTRREKWGFPIPAKRWFATDLYEPTASLLADRRTRERGLYDTAIISDALERHRSGELDASSALFDFIQVELWLRNVVEESLRPSARDATALTI